MNFLRRRHGRAAAPNHSRDDTPDREVLVSTKHLRTLQNQTSPKGTKRRYAWIFTLGGLFGLVLAAFFANNNDLIDLAALGDFNLEPLLDVLPSGLIRDAKEFQVRKLLCFIILGYLTA
jgi:phospholipid:diacylglycerol acyltransferase